MVGRLVEQEEVRAGGHDQREGEPPALTAGELDDRLVLLLPAGEEEASEQVLRLRALEAGRLLRAVEHAAGLVQLHFVLGEVGRSDAVSQPRRACDRLPQREQRLEQRRLAGSVRADERDVLAALEREADIVQQLLRAGGDLEALRLDHGPAAPRRVEKIESEPFLARRQRLELAARLLPLALEPPRLGQPRLRPLRPALLFAGALDGAAEAVAVGT